MQPARTQPGSPRVGAERDGPTAAQIPGAGGRSAPGVRLQAQLGNRATGVLVRTHSTGLAPPIDRPLSSAAETPAATPRSQPVQSRVVQRTLWDRVKSGFGVISAGLGGLAAYGGYQGASYAATALLSSNPVGWGVLGGLAAGGLVAGGVAYLSGREKPAPPVTLRGTRFDETPITKFAELQATSEANLTNCRFPQDWPDIFALNPNLRKLTIYSPHGGPPDDRFAGLVGLRTLQELELVRAEFMDAACYANLGQMRQLTRLNLNRTITKEKSPGDASMVNVAKDDEKERRIRQVTTLDPAVMQALQNLIAGGTLQHLELKWCTALTADNRAALEASAKQFQVNIVF